MIEAQNIERAPVPADPAPDKVNPTLIVFQSCAGIGSSLMSCDTALRILGSLPEPVKFKVKEQYVFEKDGLCQTVLAKLSKLFVEKKETLHFVDDVQKLPQLVESNQENWKDSHLLFVLSRPQTDSCKESTGNNRPQIEFHDDATRAIWPCLEAMKLCTNSHKRHHIHFIMEYSHTMQPKDDAWLDEKLGDHRDVSPVEYGGAQRVRTLRSSPQIKHIKKHIESINVLEEKSGYIWSGNHDANNKAYEVSLSYPDIE